MFSDDFRYELSALSREQLIIMLDEKYDIIEKLREMVNEIYALRGEDELIARICIAAIRESD